MVDLCCNFSNRRIDVARVFSPRHLFRRTIVCCSRRVTRRHVVALVVMGREFL